MAGWIKVADVDVFDVVEEKWELNPPEPVLPVPATSAHITTFREEIITTAGEGKILTVLDATQTSKRRINK